jgi:hypothetical protein
LRNAFLAALLLIGSACFSPARGQHADSLLLQSDPVLRELDSLLNSEDSLSLFRLIDSLIQLPDLKETSQMAIRLGYNSNIVATGRTLGMNQFGLSPGVSYYHKSGLYADASTYWSQEYTPDFYLSVLSGGYMKTISRRWSFLAEYSRYFYSATGANTYHPYTNNLGVSNYFTFKPVTFRLDYYFYFGEKKAHRIQPGVMVYLEKRKWHSIDRLLFFPTVTVLFGSENVVTDYVFYPDFIQRFRKNKTLPPNAQLPLYSTVSKNVFGVMNYSFVAPVSLTKKQWTFLLSYTYNIPQSLPYEDLGLKSGGYLSFSITKYIGF